MKSNQTNTSGRQLIAGAGLLAALLAGSGCEVDSFLDPSVTGRWEHTPTSVPILERIASIEGEEDAFVETSEVQPGDLEPELTEYRVAPGDQLAVEIFDLIAENVPQQYGPTIDTRGRITIPILGELYVDGLSAPEIKQVIEAAMADLVADPIVTVTVQAPRDLTYSILGGAIGAGTFFIPTSDFRLLEALTNSGGVAPNVDEIFVIRQTPLTRKVEGETARGLGSLPDADSDNEEPAQDGEALIELLDDLSQEAEDADPGFAVLATQDGDSPDAAIDLVEPEGRGPADAGGWVFVDGRWTRVRPAQNANRTTDNEDELAKLVAQRIIRVPADRLLSGDARYNMVIRPGDVIRIPAPEFGNVYMAGFVNTPGVYTVVPGLTLTRAITAARGLSGLAIPERVDLTRMIGDDRQATIRLNLRAIEDGTEPDIFLKDNDRINVGSNFWAAPLAVLRSGFRFSYGFGFLLDRNFGTDVFGPVRLDN